MQQQQYNTFMHNITHPRAGTGIVDLAWSPDSQFLASASADGVILWKAATGEELAQWERTGYVGSVAWSSTGKNLAVGTVVYRSPHRVGMVRLWHFPKEGPLKKMVKKKAICSADDPVSALSWSPDGTRLAVPLYSGKIAIIDIQNECELFQYQTDHSISTTDLAWSPDGTSIASTGAGVDRSHSRSELTYPVFVYNVLDKTTVFSQESSDWTTGLAWSPDGTRLIIGSDKTIKCWHSASNHLVEIYTKLERGNAVAWSPDGRYIATASQKYTIHIWEADTERTLTVLQAKLAYGHIDCVRWSPDGKSLAAGDSDRTVYIWPLEAIISVE